MSTKKPKFIYMNQETGDDFNKLAEALESAEEYLDGSPDTDYVIITRVQDIIRVERAKPSFEVIDLQ